MNRLTKHISLILISSSLILQGCHQEPMEEEKKDPNAPAQATSGSSTHHGGYHGYGMWGLWSPLIWHGSGASGTGSRMSNSHASSSSSRGGFGSTGHGVSS